MTDEQKELWLEGAEYFGDAIENKNLVPIMDLDEIDFTVSMPAVKYDKDPTIHTNAKPDGYRQVPFKTFYTKIEELADEVSEATTDLVDLKEGTEAARDAANAAAERSETATSEAENVNATLLGMTVTITDRTGTSTSVNIGFEIYQTYTSKALMIADAANVPQGKFVMIAASDPTDPDNATLWARNSNAASSENPFTFLSDLDQASSAAWADWLENMKPAILAAIQQAATDHTQAVSDHSTASSDHTLAASDHTTAGTDHGIASTDHTTASADHTAAAADHSQAESDHTRASADHSTANDDHSTATTDHSTASDDHAHATTDHSTAQTDHTNAVNATNAANTAAAYANTQGGYAEEWNSNPPYIGDGTTGDLNYWYLYDITTHEYIKGAYAKGNDLDYSTMTPEEIQMLIDNIKADLVFATVEETISAINELT